MQDSNPIDFPRDVSNDQRASLTAAFDFFNETSKQLSESYRLLELRVQQLQRELNEVELEKKQANRTRQKIADQMQALLNFLPAGVVVLDARGYIMEANPASKKLLDCKLVGKLWRDVIKSCFAPKNDDGLEVSTRSGKRISIATSSLGNDGQIILLADLTETRKLQQNLSRYEKLSAMGKMVSAIAHQIRTPLSAAILYAGHLKNKKLTSQQRDTFSEKIVGRLLHMEKQVQDMMLFVKNELPLNDVISLTDLELGLREAAEVTLETSNAACSWNNHAPTKKIKCHREALISAMVNLINNSVQASDKVPQLIINIDVGCRHRMEFAQVSVEDRGMGMSPQALKEAQEIFVTTKAQGTGLGLSVVQSVCRAHGGTFHLTSEHGRGTRATIEVPLLENAKV